VPQTLQKESGLRGNHGKELAERVWTTQTVENAFSLFKSAIVGNYHRCWSRSKLAPQEPSYFPLLPAFRRAAIFALISDRDRGFDSNIRRRILSNLFSATDLLLITTSYRLIQHA
jgi:hypothetical protein